MPTQFLVGAFLEFIMYTLCYGNNEVCGSFEDCQRLAKSLRQTWAILDRFGVVMAAYRGIL